MEFKNKYDKSLRRTREAVRESSNKHEAQELAQRFRMETLLQNGKLTIELVDFLKQNPTASFDDFESIIEQERIAHPEVARAFIETLLEIRDNVLQFYQEVLPEDAANSNEQLAQRIFEIEAQCQRNTNDSFQLHGEAYLDTTFPLAPILYLEDEVDYETIAPGSRGIGGHFGYNRKHSTLSKPHQLIVVNRKKGAPEETIPHEVVPEGRIVTRETIIKSEQDITKHEKDHAIMRAFRLAMAAADKQRVWGRLGHYYIEGRKTDALVQALQAHQNDIESARSQPEWKLILGYLAARVKDELLADIVVDPIMQKSDQVEKQGGTYDYIEHMGFARGSDLYAALWEEYDKIFAGVSRHYGTDVAEVVGQYAIHKLPARVQIMQFVLAQIPIEDWANQLERTGFVAEAQALERLDDRIDEFTGEQYAEAVKLFEDMIAQCNAHPAEPFFEYIRVCDQALNILQRQDTSDG